MASTFTPILPYFLSFAAGAMIYVVVEELIPEMSEGKHSNIGVIAFSIGFVLMMILDIFLGRWNFMSEKVFCFFFGNNNYYIYAYG